MPADATIDKRALLANHPLFGQLAPEELERLVAYMRLVRQPARTILFRKGDPGTHMVVVVRGRLKVCTHSEDGKELVLNLINAGEVVGEIALLDGSDRTADAVTLTDSDLLILERRDLIPFLQRHPDACMRLFAVLCARLRKTSELLEEALFLEGSSRLAKRLVHLAEIFGKPVPGGVRIDIPLSQQQLGNMVGMSRESMNKQLGQWRREDLIRMDDGYITIPDLDRLREI
jgi:CRP/FNR family transcriptional regulator, cyclic AMP receptor protein